MCTLSLSACMWVASSQQCMHADSFSHHHHYVDHNQLYPSCPPHIQPTMDSVELKLIQNTLQALTKVVSCLQKKATPSVKAPSAQTPKSQPTYASKAFSKPDNPSIVITLSHLSGSKDFSWPRPVDICNIITNALNVTPHNQVHVSAVWWTAKGNLIVTGGHLTSVQQLQLASPIIAKAFTNAYSTTVTPFTSPHTRANVKWSKILINGLLTRVTDSRGTYSPDKCHAALASENPSYAPLIISSEKSVICETLSAIPTHWVRDNFL